MEQATQELERANTETSEYYIDDLTILYRRLAKEWIGKIYNRISDKINPGIRVGIDYNQQKEGPTPLFIHFIDHKDRDITSLSIDGYSDPGTLSYELEYFKDGKGIYESYNTGNEEIILSRMRNELLNYRDLS